MGDVKEKISEWLTLYIVEIGNISGNFTSVLCKQCVHIYRVAMSGVFLTMHHTLKSLQMTLRHRGLTGGGETAVTVI